MSVGSPAPSTPERGPQEKATGPEAGGRSVVIHGDNHAPVTTGDYSPITITTVDTGPLPPIVRVPAAAGPVGITVHVPLFVGRGRELARLEQALAAGPGAVVQAVHGLGGIGKSALAARYVALHAGQYTQVVWITAEDAAGIEAGLRRFALALEPQLAALPSEALVERATEWLAAHQGWLLVLDNVTSLNDISTLLSRLGAGSGRFLATSRRSVGWNRIGATPVRLDVLEPGEALTLLAKTVGTTPDALDGGAELCTELGFLPLAITQAGAYIAQNQPEDEPSPREYLRLLAEHPAHLYATGDEDSDDEDIGPGHTIARTWRITLDRLTGTPLAGQLLRILAWYAPDQIPTSLLDPLDPLPLRPGLGEAIGKLAAYNMLTRTPRDPADPQAGRRLTVHRLVQAVTRTPDPTDPHRDPDLIAQARDQATTLLNTAFPREWPNPATWPASRRLIPHIDALAEHATPDTDTTHTSNVLHQAGLFLHYQGSLTHATSHLHRAHDGRHRLLGPDHPDTLTSRSNLAGAYESAGDLGRAIPLFEQTLTDTVRVLGEDHPYTLASRHNLACAYESAGDLGRAIPLFEQTLTDMMRVLGEDHPHTLTSRSNLAGAYESAGDLGRAIPLYEQDLTDCLRVLGPGHPDTLASRHNLACAYESAEDLGRAIPLFEQNLTDSLRVLGEDHPHTLASCNNLAGAYRSAGDLGRAIPLYEQNLTDRLRVLGPDHPDILASCNNLAGAYRSAGDLGRAIPLYEQNLTDSLRVLGEDHPHTLISRNELAVAYRSAGDLGRAIPLYEQNLTDCLRVLGPDHPMTGTVRGNLAYVLRHR
ncbi:tetratricopeptide repeat protein [Streptomyces sp. WAC05858]|uniref:tetratricopeptide repeat protein n=1 Tax=Streptomyces TaxID=1883 RepID=UPI000F7AB8C0|nr:tetratricopeptide repeat protein [Streptomyces sp. WAC05858]RSS46288.1 tetratricopeptide repeat protein [Streptomyces sp. WAC05858]